MYQHSMEGTTFMSPITGNCRLELIHVMCVIKSVGNKEQKKKSKEKKYFPIPTEVVLIGKII